jgi:hypothetical protein
MPLLVLILPLVSAALPDLRLSEERTLRTAGWSPLIEAFHRQTLDSGRVGHILPGPEPDSLAGGLSLVQGLDTSLILYPKIGIEWRNPHGEGQFAFDAGGALQGRTERLAFWVDARMVSGQTSNVRESWDGQFQEFQDQGNNSRLTYTSFSRYEGKLDFESAIGRIGMGRTREHWGPSLNYPLILGSGGVPMPLLDWTANWGNFRVRTLWASLAIDGAGGFRNNTHSRSLYGHRYEWLAANWLTIGASEALIVYDRQELSAILPFAPLFMEKGQGVENDNNGEMAFDAEVRPVPGVRCYGEFLIDDVSEPSSLFNDLWKNRWAFTTGVQGAIRRGSLDLGGLIEYSHVEPWVYSHYTANGVQAANQGFLLGNPSGPNSRSIKTTIYGVRSSLHLESSVEWVWKGSDRGSYWTDTLSDNEYTRKAFLVGGGSLFCRAELHLGWSHRYGAIWLDLTKIFSYADLQQVRPSAPVAIRGEFGL